MTSKCNRLVTIGIPTYNRADGNLRNVIERALGQTYQNVEVIVSDNCSNDHTPELVRSIVDPRLRYFRQQANIGPNKNFNFCLNQAKGEYFLLFHDDDMIDEDFIETCMSSFAPGESTGVVLAGVRIIDEHNNVLEEHKNEATGLSPVEFILGWFESKTAIYLCNTIYNTTRLREVGGFSSKKNIYDDLVATITLATRFGRVDVADVKASFRRHLENRGSTIPIRDWIEESEYLLETFCRLLPEKCNILRKEGDLYFCNKMYRYASEGMAVVPSFLDYLKIYKSYNYCYSPIHFLYRKKLGSRVRKIRQIFVGT